MWSHLAPNQNPCEDILNPTCKNLLLPIILTPTHMVKSIQSTTPTWDLTESHVCIPRDPTLQDSLFTLTVAIKTVDLWSLVFSTNDCACSLSFQQHAFSCLKSHRQSYLSFLTPLHALLQPCAIALNRVNTA